MRLLTPLLALLLATPLAAQDPADTATTDTAATPDTVRPHPRPHPRQAPNPYLREAGEDEPLATSPNRLHHRGGWWASLGAGAGNESVQFDGPNSTYAGSRIRPTFNAAIGGSVGQFMRIGLEGFVWLNLHGNGLTESISSAMVGARVYPFPRAGLYFHAAGGMGFYNLNDDYDPCGCVGSVIHDIGGAWALGAGIDLPMSRGVWVGPMVDVVYVDMLDPADYRERVIHVGLSITFDGH